MKNSDSYKAQSIIKYFNSRGIGFISDVKVSQSPSADFVVFIQGDHVGQNSKKGVISSGQMNRLQVDVKRELSLTIEWVVTPSQQASSLENALQSLIDAHHPGVVAGVFISSLQYPPVVVWVESVAGADFSPILENIQKLIQKFFDLFDVDNPTVVFGDSDNIPNMPIILRQLKIHAPLKVTELRTALQSCGFEVPNERWLQSQMDKYRKKGWVSRTATGEYALTGLGLELVPRNYTRSSSDVARALALARRKW